MTGSNQHKELVQAIRQGFTGFSRYSDAAHDALDSLIEQLETLRNCVEEYADLDGWETVRSPETTSAWQKRWGHPTPWVDAQHALDGVSSPATEPRCYCGDLTWTEKQYGRVTHKHACPARTEPWCQTHPEGDCDPAMRFQCQVGPGCPNATPDGPCCGIPASEPEAK